MTSNPRLGGDIPDMNKPRRSPFVLEHDAQWGNLQRLHLLSFMGTNVSGRLASFNYTFPNMAALTHLNMGNTEVSGSKIIAFSPPLLALHRYPTHLPPNTKCWSHTCRVTCVVLLYVLGLVPHSAEKCPPNVLLSQMRS